MTRSGERDHKHDFRVSPRVGYTLAGLLLGLGAPIGALLIRMLYHVPARSSPASEIRANLFFYGYSLVATCVVFAVAGAVAGARAHRLRTDEAFYHDLSELDPMTGLLNGRALREQSQRIRERALRFGIPVSLLLIDVDRLKQINDEHGHDTGNLALQRVAHAIRHSKRASDVAARWGGDEFAVGMEGADVPAARRVADAIASAVRNDGARPPLTVTIGVASAAPTGAQEDLFAAADGALYEGKRAGGDRVSVARA